MTLQRRLLYPKLVLLKKHLQSMRLVKEPLCRKWNTNLASANPNLCVEISVASAFLMFLNNVELMWELFIGRRGASVGLYDQGLDTRACRTWVLWMRKRSSIKKKKAPQIFSSNTNNISGK